MTRKILAGIFLAVVMLGGGYFLWQWFHRTPVPAASSGVAGVPVAQPTARVRVVQGRFGKIAEQLTVYGDVIPAPGSIQTVTLPFESQVVRVMVNSGGRLSAGDLLAEVKPGPAAKLQLEEARNAFTSAQQNLAQVEGRFKLQLITNDQVLQAQQALDLARVRLESIQSGQQTLKDGQIHASVRGLVNTIPIHEGQIVPVGSPLLEIVEGAHLEVRLGIEPEDIGSLSEGDPVGVSRIGTSGSGELQGRIHRLSQVVNPTTHLIDAFIELPPDNRLFLREPVVGRLTISSARGFIVPRNAVLPEGGEFVLFTVLDGRARRHSVKIGLENDHEIQIVSPSPGQEPIVVLGNHVLQDGMAVVVEQGQ